MLESESGEVKTREPRVDGVIPLCFLPRDSTIDAHVRQCITTEQLKGLILFLCQLDISTGLGKLNNFKTIKVDRVGGSREI